MPLRPLVESDLATVLAWRNAPEVRKYMYTHHEISEAEHLAWFGRLQNDPASLWLIYLSDEGQANGVVYFTQYDALARTAFWGFYSAPDSLPGTGTRLGLAALDYAFFELNLHKLNAEATAVNEPSRRLQTKLGFKEEGLFRDFYYNGVLYLDVVRFGILSSEWVCHKEIIQAGISRRDALAASAIARGGSHS